MNGANEHTTTTDSLLFLHAIRGVLGRTPLWLLVSSVIFLLTLPVAIPRFNWFQAATSHRVEPGALVHSLSTVFRQDHREALGALDASTASAGAILLLIAGLLSVFAAGGWLQVILERTYGQSLRRFFYGGARYFWRFFRFWILTLVVLAGLRWILYEWPWNTLVLQVLLDVPKADFARLESLESEAGVRWLGFAQDGIFAVGFVLVVLVWGPLSRTRVALHDTSSAVWAGLCSAFTILRHPVKTMRPILALLLLEACVVTWLAGKITRWLDEGLEASPSRSTIVMLMVVSLLALIWREILRGARYYASVQVSRELVRPLSRPDPWKSIGGPGGPQYPVGGDEYGVSM